MIHSTYLLKMLTRFNTIIVATQLFCSCKNTCLWKPTVSDFTVFAANSIDENIIKKMIIDPPHFSLEIRWTTQT